MGTVHRGEMEGMTRVEVMEYERDGSRVERMGLRMEVRVMVRPRRVVVAASDDMNVRC